VAAEAALAISTLETRMTIKTLAAKGQPNRAIARQLGMAESTVRYHRVRIPRKPVTVSIAWRSPIPSQTGHDSMARRSGVAGGLEDRSVLADGQSIFDSGSSLPRGFASG
jgi:hypothetical protein